MLVSIAIKKVASYIFGGNMKRRDGPLGRWAPRWTAVQEESRKIAMTAPVQTELRDSGGGASAEGEGPLGETRAVSFTMPSQYTSVEDLPVPTNRNVTLREVPRHYAAVVGFRGRPPPAARVESVRLAMQAALAKANLRMKAGRGVFVYQYHDPFLTPNLLRWNEVTILLEPHGVQEALQ